MLHNVKLYMYKVNFLSSIYFKNTFSTFLKPGIAKKIYRPKYPSKIIRFKPKYKPPVRLKHKHKNKKKRKIFLIKYPKFSFFSFNKKRFRYLKKK